MAIVLCVLFGLCIALAVVGISVQNGLDYTDASYRNSLADIKEGIRKEIPKKEYISHGLERKQALHSQASSDEVQVVLKDYQRCIEKGDVDALKKMLCFIDKRDEELFTAFSPKQGGLFIKFFPKGELVEQKRAAEDCWLFVLADSSLLELSKRHQIKNWYRYFASIPVEDTESLAKMSLEEFREAVIMKLDAPDGLRYRVEPEKETFLEGEPVVVTFSIENVTRKDIRLKYNPSAEIVDLGNAITARGAIVFPIGPEPLWSNKVTKFADVTIKIYDTSGKLVRTVNLGKIQDEYSTQELMFQWDGKDDDGNKLPNGVYFCYIQDREVSATRKMVITDYTSAQENQIIKAFRVGEPPGISNRGLMLYWQPDSRENKGWNVYRSETAMGQFVKVNNRLLPVSDKPYYFVDVENILHNLPKEQPPRYYRLEGMFQKHVDTSRTRKT
jgi:hypothetical protein